MWYAVIRFFIGFFSVSSLLIFIASLVNAVHNPKVGLDKEGNLVERGRNARIWIGLIASFFWALFFVV